MDESYTVVEAAKYLGYSVRALRYHLNTARHLKADSKRGRLLIFNRVTLDAFAVRQKHGGIGQQRPGNIDQVAQQMGISVQTVGKWLKRGLFPHAVQTERYWYIPSEDVANFTVPDPEVTYIYALRDPETGGIRYVGKSDDPVHRLYEHLVGQRPTRSDIRNQWLHSLQEKGLMPILEVLEVVPFAEWREREQAWIQAMRVQGHDLVN